MKMKCIALVLVLIFLCLCTGCTFPWVYDWFPASQTGTTWRSDDGNAVIYIPNGEPYRTTPYGRISSGDAYVDVVFSMGPQADEIAVYLAEYLDELESAEPVETSELWAITTLRKNRFSVCVTESTWLPVGKTMNFTKEAP